MGAWVLQSARTLERAEVTAGSRRYSGHLRTSRAIREVLRVFREMVRMFLDCCERLKEFLEMPRMFQQFGRCFT